ncbi:MAG: RnfH family protein, partial [Magnetococcales bacterium]|nr:RnfH family protein [Magnetococcales bacterium]
VNKIGIFSKLVPLDQKLNDGDRVEIYRPAMGKPPKKERPAKGAAGAANPEEGAGEE